MQNTSLYRMVDRALDGHLAEILLGYRDQNLSPGRMALRLAAEHQVEVSGQTLKKWVAALPPSGAVGAQTARTAQNAQTAQSVDGSWPQVAVAS